LCRGVFVFFDELLLLLATGVISFGEAISRLANPKIAANLAS
jgi:hypothetical protein